MDREQMEKTIKSYVLDSLMAQSGHQLTPEVISIISIEVMERIKDVLSMGKE